MSEITDLVNELRRRAKQEYNGRVGVTLVVCSFMEKDAKPGNRHWLITNVADAGDGALDDPDAVWQSVKEHIEEVLGGA